MESRSYATRGRRPREVAFIRSTLLHSDRVVSDADQLEPVYAIPPSGSRAELVRRLGVDRLWGRDPARAWRLARVAVVPALARLAPGSAVYGAERIPRDGGVLIAANHFTALDPVLIGLAAPRGVHFFAKGQLFRRSVLTEVIRWVGSIPVGVGFDNRAALRHASALLGAGRVVGIFIEGARQRSDEPGEAMPGAALLAVGAGVPVVPCGLDTFGWSKRHRRPCTVVFGHPLRFDAGSGRERTAQATARIGEEVEKAWRAAVAAGEAGRPRVLAGGTRRRGWLDVWKLAFRHRARA
jgi:1-acyl-sn-glycerol-3-phosphate acyltransferase